MKVTVWSYLDQLKDEKAQLMEIISSVLDSGQLVLGSEVDAFEKEFSRYCNRDYGIGLNSGTDALFLALKVMGVGAGDEVITVSNTAVPTVSAIVSTGAVPVFVDVDAETYLMDVSKVEGAITDKTRCILPVHLFGQCVDMSTLGDIARKYDLRVLEDCAQAHGALHNGQLAGSMSDISAFSFYPTKLLGTYGDGGMALTNSADYAQKLKRLHFYGMEKTYYAVEHGYNSRLDEIHAAILRFKLSKLDDYIARRKAIAAVYDANLNSDLVKLPVVAKGNSHAFYLYVCRHKKRNEIIEKLRDVDIHVNVSYPWPIHTMDAYRHFRSYGNTLSNTEQAAEEVFSLPMYPELSELQQSYVISHLNEILKNL